MFNLIFIFMEKLKKLLEFLSPLPSWLRVIIVALVTAIVSVCVLMTACTVASSCGITQSVVNNIDSDGNTIEMGVTPSTTTSTTASPDLSINDPIMNDMWLVSVVILMMSGGSVKRRLLVESSSEDLAFIKAANFMRNYIRTSSRYMTCKIGKVSHYLDSISFKD